MIAVELEPANDNYIRNLSEMCYHLRRWDEVRTLQKRMIGMIGGNLREELYSAGVIEGSITGSDAAFRAYLAKLTPARREEPITLFFRKGAAINFRDTAEFKRLDALQPALEDEEEPVISAISAAFYLWSVGEKDAAAARMAPFSEAARQQAAQQPGNPIAQQTWGFCQLLGGKTDEGIATLRATMQMLPTANDAMDGPNYEYSYLEACAMTGRLDEVWAGLPRLMSVPNLFPTESIRLDPAFAALRDDPRFLAILKDPANNRAPLY